MVQARSRQQTPISADRSSSTFCFFLHSCTPLWEAQMRAAQQRCNPYAPLMPPFALCLTKKPHFLASWACGLRPGIAQAAQPSIEPMRTRKMQSIAPIATKLDGQRATGWTMDRPTDEYRLEGQRGWRGAIEAALVVPCCAAMACNMSRRPLSQHPGTAPAGSLPSPPAPTAAAMQPGGPAPVKSATRQEAQERGSRRRLSRWPVL